MNDTLPVFAIQRLRMETDGEGITTLVGVHGCPLRCRYCINKMVWDENTEVRHFTPEELYQEVKVDDLYFRATNGGITFGGGESLLYSPFIRTFKEQFASDWNIGLETSLHAPAEFVEEAAKAVDFFIVDCKDWSETIYKTYTGKTGALMRENLKLLLELAGPERIRVRVPHIPQFNEEKDWKYTVSQLEKLGVSNIEEFTYLTGQLHVK